MNEQVADWIPLVGVGLIVVPVGLILGYFFWVNNSSDTRDMRAVLFASKPYDIRSVAITAGESSRKVPTPSLITEGLSISDASAIAEVMAVLATAVEGNPPKGPEDWIAMLHVTHAKREVPVEVVRFSSQGAWLFLKSGGKSGWNLGTYRCEKLGPLMERLAGHGRKPGEIEQPATPPATEIEAK